MFQEIILFSFYSFETVRRYSVTLLVRIWQYMSVVLYSAVTQLGMQNMQSR